MSGGMGNSRLLGLTSGSSNFVSFSIREIDSPLFDRYAFARKNDVLLIDEFDLINKDLLIYRAFSPDSIRARVKFAPTLLDMTWIIRVANGKSFREGELFFHDRARGVTEVMERFVHELPDMSIIYNGHDAARIALAYEERMRLENLARAGVCESRSISPVGFFADSCF